MTKSRKYCKETLMVGCIFFFLCFGGYADELSSEELSSNKREMLVLQEIESERGIIEAIQPAQDVFPGLPISKRLSDYLFYDQEGGRTDELIALDEPDDIDPGGNSDESPHSLPRDFYYVYSLRAVPPKSQDTVRSKLNNLERTPLYGTYIVLPRAEALKTLLGGLEIEFSIEMNHLNRADIPGLRPVQSLRARYARVVDVSNGSIDMKKGTLKTSGYSFQLPEGWATILSKDSPKKIWVECAIKLNPDGLPADAPLRRVRPIAIETASSLYLVTFGIKKVGGKHGYSVRFHNEAFALKGVSASAVRDLMDSFHSALKNEFSRSPLEAQEDISFPAPPGEFHFRRDRRPSTVLAGFAGPYNELSYYVVRWWKADDEELYSILPPHKGGYGATGSKIFVQVSNSLTVSVGASKEYVEPTDSQNAQYQEAISTSIQAAITDTAKRYGGKHNGSAFEIDFSNVKGNK